MCALLLVAACPPAGPGEPDVDAGVDVDDDAGVVTQCPTRLRFTGLGGGQVNVGWTGVTHNVSLPEGAVFFADVVQCDEACRNCRFEGPTRDLDVNPTQRCMTDTALPCDDETVCPNHLCVPVAVNPQTGDPILRCENNPTVSCTSPADCDPGACSVFLGPNIASPIRNNAFGLVFQSLDASPPIRGRIDLETGQLAFDQFGVWVASSDVNVVGGFPPICEGDDVRNDGVKNGTCVTNPYAATVPGATANTASLGDACDAHGNAGIPTRAGVYSLDCAIPLTLSFDLSTRNAGTAVSPLWVLDPALQPVDANGAPLWCGLCAGTTQACHSDEDCPAGGTCDGTTLPNPAVNVPPRNNFCVPGAVCAWDEEALSGTCTGVAGVNPQTGQPIITTIPCLPTGDDARLLLRGRSERLSARSFSVSSVGLACAGPTPFLQSNQGLGLPGPNVSRYTLRVDAE